MRLRNEKAVPALLARLFCNSQADGFYRLQGGSGGAGLVSLPWMGLTIRQNIKIAIVCFSQQCDQVNVNDQHPVVIKPAFPPAAVVFTLTVRSVTSRHSAMGILLLVASVDTMAPSRAARVVNTSATLPADEFS